MAIKSLPEDFIVDEVLDPAYLAKVSRTPAPFVVYHLAKTSLTTPEAVGFFAKALGMPGNKVLAAGLKDKHGVTSQHVTVEAGRGADKFPATMEAQGWKARRVGFTHAPINSQAIQANRFKVTIRAMTRKDNELLDEAAKSLMTGSNELTSGKGRLLVVNYYGNQRFGGARAGEGFLAPLLIKGKFEEALKIILATPHRKDMRNVKHFKQTCKDNWGQWKEMLPKLPKMQLRLPIEKLIAKPGDFKAAFQALPYFEQQMAVEAWQSLLWNRVACRLVETHCAPCREIDDTYCKLAFPTPGSVPGEWRHMMLPVLGKNSELRDPWSSAAAAVLEEENVTTADLKIPGVERPWFAQVERQLFIEAADFHAANPQQDETQDKAIRFKRTLSFSLPRGCYATVLLRALGH